MVTPKSKRPTPLGILDLPVELLRSITARLSPSSAASLALTCRQLQAPAESVLWNHLIITDRATESTPSTPASQA